MEIFPILLNIAVTLFAVSSMLTVGFQHKLKDVLSPLRDIPGLITAVATNFVLVPLLAVSILWLIPLDRPMATGLTLVSVAAGAPMLIKLASNAARGLFRGLPVGGSLSTTALTVISGARTRWAAIFAGLWMALLVVMFPGLVSYVAMPALGMLLILASVSTIKPSEALSIWQTGWASRLVRATPLLPAKTPTSKAAFIIADSTKFPLASRLIPHCPRPRRHCFRLWCPS